MDYSEENTSPADESLLMKPQQALKERFHFSWKKLLRYMGPGFLMSIAYLDPGNLQADIQLGAVAGYKLLWLLLASILLGGVFQSRAINVSVVTGKHLAEHCRMSFPKPVYLLLWCVVELAIIGADIQEVLGSAIALNILTNGFLSIWQGTLITVVDTCIFLLLQQSGVRRLEFFFGVLITVMSTMFGYLYFAHLPPQLEILKGVCIPKIPPGSITQAVGMIGAVIMPHNLYLHSALTLTRDIDRSQPNDVRDSIAYNHIESAIALILSFFINMFVVCNFASLNIVPEGILGSQIGVASAARCLQLNYGTYYKYMWAIGLLASGQSSTCTGTLTGQYVMQGFLKMEISAWKRLSLVRFFAVCPAICVAAFTESRQRIDEISEWLNILQAVLLPFSVLPLICFSASKLRLGSYSDSIPMRTFLYIAVVIIIAANFSSCFDVVRSFSLALDMQFWTWASVSSALYLFGLSYFVRHLWAGEVYSGR
ncbi:solute carrier family 11 member 1 [Perkinsela sp. CCAP 1560/4]|nr:solute carrier family 11 member 1 [Perkinsela sp. CCAP 1560/4]|eukprot:KNH09531.1 solute carrier family 11 member 1 [Perkinsela sp. CCAP 1560/4]